MIHWDAEHYSKGDKQLVNTKWAEEEGTGAGPGAFDYIPKMTIMLTSNQLCGPNSVALKVANGVTAFAVGIVLHADEPDCEDSMAPVWNLLHVPQGILAHVPGIRVKPLANLPQSAIDLADGHDESIIYVPAAKVEINRKSKVTRYQVQCSPSYALTFHKAQGLGLERVIIDTQTPIGADAHNKIYVGFSRCITSTGFAILGPYAYDLIHHAPHKDLAAFEVKLKQKHDETMKMDL